MDLALYFCVPRGDERKRRIKVITSLLWKTDFSNHEREVIKIQLTERSVEVEQKTTCAAHGYVDAVSLLIPKSVEPVGLIGLRFDS